MFKYEKSLEMKTAETMKKCEGLLDQMFKVSGMSVMDVLSFDSETGAMIGGCMDLYRDSKELAVMYAKTMDKLSDDFDELKARNEVLCKQNDEMQRLLRDLNRKVENIGK